MLKISFMSGPPKAINFASGSKKAWLFTTLHRAFLVGRLRNNRFPHCEMEEGQLPPASLPANHLDSAHALTALSKVGGVFQPALTLFYLEDCSCKDIAELLQVAVGTVRSRLARDLSQLRRDPVRQQSGSAL